MTTPTEPSSSQLRAALRDGTVDGTWLIDPSRSTVTFKSKSVWGLVKINGSFGEVAGQAVIAAGEVSGHVTVKAASVDTKNAKRDKHLNSADFFDSGRHPDIAFNVSSVAAADTNASVTGTLTVRGTSHEITFPAVVAVTGATEATVDATFTLNRTDYGLTWNQMGMASTDNALTIHAVLTKSV